MQRCGPWNGSWAGTRTLHHNARGRIAKSFLLMALLAAVQIGLVHQVQWVRRELSGLGEIRMARRAAHPVKRGTL